jgi:hypothetical protein
MQFRAFDPSFCTNDDFASRLINTSKHPIVRISLSGANRLIAVLVVLCLAKREWHISVFDHVLDLPPH